MNSFNKKCLTIEVPRFQFNSQYVGIPHPFNQSPFHIIFNGNNYLKY